jgi:hypothetical protein
MEGNWKRFHLQKDVDGSQTAAVKAEVEAFLDTLYRMARADEKPHFVILGAALYHSGVKDVTRVCALAALYFRVNLTEELIADAATIVAMQQHKNASAADPVA